MFFAWSKVVEQRFIFVKERSANMSPTDQLFLNLLYIAIDVPKELRKLIFNITNYNHILVSHKFL